MSIIVSADKNKDVIAHAIDADNRIYEIAHKWCCSEAGTNNVVNFEDFKASADADDIDLKKVIEKSRIGLLIIERSGDNEIVVSVITNKIHSGWFNVAITVKREFCRRFYILKVLHLGHQCTPLPAAPASSSSAVSSITTAPMRNAPRLLQMPDGMSLNESLIAELKHVHERRKMQQHQYVRQPIVATVGESIIPSTIVVGLKSMTVSSDASSDDEN